MSSVNELLENRIILQEVSKLERHLSRFSPDGKKNHKKEGIRHGLLFIKEGAIDFGDHPKDLTFKRCEEQNPELYKKIKSYFIDAFLYFNYKI